MMNSGTIEDIVEEEVSEREAVVPYLPSVKTDIAVSRGVVDLKRKVQNSGEFIRTIHTGAKKFCSALEEKTGHNFEDLPLLYRSFVLAEAASSEYFRGLKRESLLEKAAGNLAHMAPHTFSFAKQTLGNLGYLACEMFFSFPNGNAMPSKMQVSALEEQGRNKMTYALWGLGASTLAQGGKLGAAYGAASTDSGAGYAVAGGLGLWAAYKSIQIPLRAGLMITTKKPIPYLTVEGPYQGYIQTRKGIRKLDPVGKIRDLINVAKEIKRRNSKE